VVVHTASGGPTRRGGPSRRGGPTCLYALRTADFDGVLNGPLSSRIRTRIETNPLVSVKYRTKFLSSWQY